MRGTIAVFRRELGSYLFSPLAFVFTLLFVFLTGIFTFYMGDFFERNQADLVSFFSFHPYLYLFLMPALSMRLWAEERKTGTIELLLTLPISSLEALLGKFFAAWVFAGVGLLCTFPMWITITYLGHPDHGAVISGYIGSFMLAGAFLSIGSCLSAATSSHVIAFILTAVACFLFLVTGFPIVLDTLSGWAPGWMIAAFASFSALGHFETFVKGVIDGRAMIYFISMISIWLTAGVLTIDWVRGR
jgi:ABC-2 type transport system permease protein